MRLTNNQYKMVSFTYYSNLKLRKHHLRELYSRDGSCQARRRGGGGGGGGGGCSWVTDKHQQNMVHTHSILVRSPPAAPWAWCHIMLLEATLIRSSRKVMEHARDLIRRWSSAVGKVTLTLGQVIPSFTRPGPPMPIKKKLRQKWWIT